MRRATSSCVRLSCRRRSRIMRPNVRSFDRVMIAFPYRQQRAPAKRAGSKQLSRPDSLGVRPTVLTQGRTQTPDFLAVILNHYGPANRPAMELGNNWANFAPDGMNRTRLKWLLTSDGIFRASSHSSLCHLLP